VRRKTCLYCEQEGVETQLVRAGRKGFCPIHSADYLKEASAVPEGYALVKKPVLLKIGRPNWPHRG
jgi:hypothetical protein